MKTYSEKLRETWRLLQKRGVWFLVLAGALGFGAYLLPSWRPYFVLSLLTLGALATFVLSCMAVMWWSERFLDASKPTWREDPWDDLD